MIISSPLVRRGRRNTAINDWLIQMMQWCTELVHQIWTQSNQRFVCTKTYPPIRDQVTVEIQRCAIKGRGDTQMNLLIKFEFNSIIGLFQNARKLLDKSEARWRKFSGSWLIRVPNGCPQQILAQWDQRCVWKCAETDRHNRGLETVGIQGIMPKRKHAKKVIIPKEDPDEFAQRIWTHSNLRLVWKCAEIERPIRPGNNAKPAQRSVTQH